MMKTSCDSVERLKRHCTLVFTGCLALSLAGFVQPRDRGQRPPARSAPATLPASEAVWEVRDGYRYLKANGIPNHTPGRFPNRNNPNPIFEQDYTFRMPAAPTTRPQQASRPPLPPTPVRRYLFGVALNGVVFDPGTAEAWKDDPRSGWNIEAIPPKGVQSMNLGLDQSNAHVQPSGAYHYHATPEGLIEKLLAAKGAKDGEIMLLIGYAADGFPVYDHHGYSNPKDATSPLKHLKSSYRLKSGTRPGGEEGPGGKHDGTYTQDYEYAAGAGDLDECNGRFGVTPEYPSGTYYYVVTSEFPYVGRYFRGAPDESFRHQGGPPPDRGGPPGAGGPGRPPRG